jgi:hypothetical protein
MADRGVGPMSPAPVRFELRTRRDAAIAVSLGLVSFLPYLRTLAPSVLPGDSGEFQLAASVLGVAHPTGYPLYLLLGKLFITLVPVGDPAFRMNLLSAVFAAAAVSAVYLLALELTRRSTVAAVAALTLAFSITFWSQAAEAEVYALNSLLVAATLLLLLRATAQPHQALATQPRETWLLAAAGCYGLSLAHHRTAILLAPAILVYLWLERRRLPTISAGRALQVGTLVLLPLLLYAYIPLRAPATPYFHQLLAPGTELTVYDGSLTAFVQVFSGRGFQSELALGDLPARLTMACSFLVDQFTMAGVALGLLGLLAFLKHGLARWLLFVLSLGGVLAFCLAYHIGDVADLFTPIYVVFAILIALGAESIAVGLSRAAGRRQVVAALTALSLLLPAVLFINNLPLVDRGRDDTRQQWQAVLNQPIAAGAVLLTDNRDEMMPLYYLQFVEGQRTDLLGLFPLLLPEPGYANIVRLLDTASRTGRPLYLLKDMPGIELRYTSHPEGLLFRVDGAVVATTPRMTANADLQGQVRLLGADVSPPGASCCDIAGPPQSESNITVTVWWQGTGKAEVNYQAFVHLVDAQGLTVRQSDHRPGGDFYPSSLWQAGETLRDIHRLPAPPPGAYELLVGMYRAGGARLGEAISLGTVVF